MHMELIKENKKKQRKVYKLKDRYRKEWSYCDRPWLLEHVNLLEKVFPNFVLAYGEDGNSMFIETKLISGVAASTLDHTPDFIHAIYKFCLENINETAPYAHGDWVLSNIIINNNKMTMVDWDNLNLYPRPTIIKKLHEDLQSAFGDKFDPTSI